MRRFSLALFFLLAASLPAGCGSAPPDGADAERAVYEAAIAYRAAAPVLDEWWVRYVKAWQKAVGP